MRSTAPLTTLLMPLALSFFAPALYAGQLKHITPTGCAVAIGSGTCTLSELTTGTNANWNGISLSTDGGVSSGSGPNSSTVVDLVANATLTGAFDIETLPVFWDFSALNVVVSDALAWHLTVTTDIGFPWESVVFSRSGTGSTNSTEITGSSVTAVLFGSVANLRIELITSNAAGHGYTLNVPYGHSVDLNGGGSVLSGTPEPGSMLLALTGLAGVIAMYRRGHQARWGRPINSSRSARRFSRSPFSAIPSALSAGAMCSNLDACPQLARTNRIPQPVSLSFSSRHPQV